MSYSIYSIQMLNNNNNNNKNDIRIYLLNFKFHRKYTSKIMNDFMFTFVFKFQ
jgi:hypothetical protein